MKRVWPVSLAFLLAAGLAGLPANPARPDDKAGRDFLGQVEETFQALIEQAEPSIACVLVSRSEAYRRLFQDAPPEDNPGKLGGFSLPAPARPDLPQFGDPRLPETGDPRRKYDLSDPNNVPEAYGSGVVVDARGLILTNYHVVRDAAKIYVRLPGHKSGSYANIHAADPRSDLAVLSLVDNLGPLRPIRFGDGAAVRKGQLVLSLANPFAAGFRDGSPSASWGLVSNVRRRAPASDKEDDRLYLHHYGTLIQTDARLNLGCSGGALLDRHGKLIGLTTALAALSGSETAGGFAVPMDARVQAIVQVLLRGEEVEYGYLGVELWPEDGHGNGVQLKDVTDGGPAQRASLQARDTILAVNGMPVRDNDGLFLAVGSLLAGTPARVEVRSGNQAPRTVTVRLGKFYVPGKAIASRRPAPFRGLRVDHTSVPFLQQRGAFFPRRIAPGVWVSEVAADSPAARDNLKVGEVITHVNGRPVADPAEFHGAVRTLPPAAPVTLTLTANDGGPGTYQKQVP